MSRSTSRKRFLLVHLLPFVHLCACLTITLAPLESGWQYLIIVDAPASVLIVTLIYSFDHPLIVFGTVGTLWWYLLSRGAEIWGTRLFATVRNRRT